MATFKEKFISLIEERQEFASIKELVTKTKLLSLLKKFKQSKTNFSIKRKTNETNIIDIKLSDEVYMSKKEDDKIKFYIVPESLGIHNYSKHVLEDALDREMSDSFVCYKVDGFLRDYIGVTLKSSSSLSGAVESLLDSLSYDGYKYKGDKLENALTDYIKLIWL